MRQSEIILAAGCFWCIEACYMELVGVISVEPGYSGGQTLDPTYNSVMTGTTGHAEAARIVFDESVLSFERILEAFFFVHDPTQLNRQGADVGTQYRSAIFYMTKDQEEIAVKTIKKLTEDGVFPNEIVTEVTKATEFYPAEDYHKNYLARNPENPYCQFVVRPKYEKFKNAFAEISKNELT